MPFKLAHDKAIRSPSKLFTGRKKSLPYNTSGKLLSPNDLGPVDFGRLAQGSWLVLWKQYILTEKKMTMTFIFLLPTLTLNTAFSFLLKSYILELQFGRFKGDQRIAI